jgi:hypothetical protein
MSAEGTAASGRLTTMPGRRMQWTRLGIAMGYTDTAAKRAEIHAEIEEMEWEAPDRLAGVLETAPVRFLLAGLFFGRRRMLRAAATTDLRPDVAGRERRLIGLESVTGDRYVLLEVGYEAVDVLHQTVTQELARDRTGVTA